MVEAEDVFWIIALLEGSQTPVFVLAVGAAYPGLVVAVEEVNVGAPLVGRKRGEERADPGRLFLRHGLVREPDAVEVEEGIVINRSPEEVFAFFDRTNDPKWMKSVLESEWLDSGTTTGLGRRGRFVMKAMGRREFVDEVTEYEPGRVVAHRFVSGPMVFHAGCIAEPAGDGCRATVTYEPERFPGGVVGRMMAPLILRMIRRNYRADLARLKDILEAEAKVSA